MSAPAGNQYWTLRSSHGAKPTFATPEDMWTAACEYFDWATANPLESEKIFMHAGTIVRGVVSKLRAFTAQGMCNYWGISSRCYRSYRENKDFLPVMDQIEQIIFEQKFTGAAADLLNANLIARDLGLADRQELSGPEGGPIPVQRVERVVVDPGRED